MFLKTADFRPAHQSPWRRKTAKSSKLLEINENPSKIMVLLYFCVNGTGARAENQLFSKIFSSKIFICPHKNTFPGSFGVLRASYRSL